MKTHSRSNVRVTVCLAAAVLVTWLAGSGVARAQQDQIYFPKTTNTINLIVNAINAEKVRIDISAWYLTEHLISEAIVSRFQAGVPVRVIGDRGAIFEIDKSTKLQFYYLVNAGVPIRLRYNPTWYPEIDHWKAAIFKGQGLVEFGSANWATYELTAASSTNYPDETVMFTTDPTLVGAFETKFDTIWNDTTTEPESVISGPPYLKNWWDACSAEAALGTTAGCSDFSSYYPNPAPMTVNTQRLEPNNYMPPDLIWGQGTAKVSGDILFNNRLVTEIDNEYTKIKFVIYRLTVDNVTTALLNKFQSGVPVQLVIEPNEYLNRKWPEFWLTHANIDKLWAAGVPIKQRAHTGLTHMKMLVTSNYATNASSNYSAGWQRDNDYFVSATGKPTIYQAMSNYFDMMWSDTTDYSTFVPQPPDSPTLSSPGNTASSVSQTPTLTWNRAAFAVSYDIYLGTSTSNMVRVANVPAQMTSSPPSTYSWTPGSALNGGTTYYWQVVSRTNATVKNASLVGPSAVWSFTTSGTPSSTPPPPPPPSGSVPSPWANTDIGSTGLAGSASYSNGVFTVSGAGSDIWGSSDSFQYVYRPISGDTTIVARVTSEQNTNTYAKAGVMFRGALSSNAADVIFDVTPSGNVEFMTRSTSGGSTTWLAGASQPIPTWLKLVLSGSTVTGYVSSSGSTWTQVGTTTLSMSGGYVGLAVCSHNTSALNTSTFDSVNVSGSTSSTALPSPFANQDIGSPTPAGSASYSNSVYTVKGGGADIWGTADAFQYVYKPLAGDGQLIVRVTSEQNTNTYAKAGIDLRETLTAGSTHVILDIKPGAGIEFMSRASTGGTTSWLAGATQAFPAWLKLVRSGTTVIGYVSADGNTWTQVGSTTVSMATNAYIGLAVCSHDTSALNTATFDSVK